MNVDAMLRAMSLPRFFELKAYYEMEPRGDQRTDLHWARWLHLFFNMNVAKRDQKPLDDFFLTFGERMMSEAKPDTAPDDERQRMLAANTAAVAAFKILAETGMLSSN